MGNEYHTVCCGIGGIMFSVELVEGRDRHPEFPPPKHDSTGNTTSYTLDKV
jgi:hypothetical protein